MDLGGAVLSAAVLGFFSAAVLAMVDRKAGYGASTAASMLLFIAAVYTLLGGPVHGFVWTGPIGDPESLGLDGLSAFFALAASLVWIATSIYSLTYDEGPSSQLAVFYAVTLGAIALLLSSSSFLLFVVGWEVMTLASYGMILRAYGRTDRVFGAAFVFLAFGEASTLLVLLAVAALRVGSGTFAEVPFGGAAGLADVVFLAGLVGFGLKMGVAPFHMSEWLPIAHSSAPSNASAVLSSTLTLAGAYGLFRLLSLLVAPPIWWGAVVLSIGAVSALLGALFAAVSEHTKGLPAYSTIENNGLILVALGIALLAESDGLRYLALFALFAAFYQAIAHAIAKTGLFLTAGYLEHTAHTFDLNATRSKGSNLPATARAGAIAATLSLAAAPPLAGFVGEWMILEAMFQSYRFTPIWVQFIGLLAGAAVALAAGLILVAMVKFLGFGLLWRPEGRGSSTSTSGLAAPIALVGALLLGIGVSAPWLLRFLTPTVSAFLGASVSAPVGEIPGLSIPNGWSVLSGSPLFGVLSPPVVPIGILLGLTVAVGYWSLAGRTTNRRVASWMAGSVPGQPGEVYTSFGFSTGIRIMMNSTLRTREIRSRTGAVVTAEVATPLTYNVDLEVLDVFKLFYDGLVSAGNFLSEFLKAFIMPGRLGRYLAYLLLVMMAVVIVVAAAA